MAVSVLQPVALPREPSSTRARTTVSVVRRVWVQWDARLDIFDTSNGIANSFVLNEKKTISFWTKNKYKYIPAIAYRQQSLMLAGHFSLHFCNFSFAELFVPLTSATTALVFVISPSLVSVMAADLLACLADGVGAAPSPPVNAGLAGALADAALLDLPNWSGWNRFLYSRSEITRYRRGQVRSFAVWTAPNVVH